MEIEKNETPKYDVGLIYEVQVTLTDESRGSETCRRRGTDFGKGTGG